MEGIEQLLNPVLGILNSEHLDKYLSTCREHLAFQGHNKRDEAPIKTVNQLLSDNSDRYGGLTVLRVVLEQCSVDSYTCNACSWLTNCVKATNDKESNIVNISFNVLGVLLQMATKFPEIKKFASNNIVPRFLEHTARPVNNQTISSLLECLKVCMKEYSGPCGSSRKSITSLLSKLVNAESGLLSQASKCYALLAQIKCSSNPGVSYNSYWKENQLILVNTLHYHMDRLFNNVHEIQVYQKHDTGKKTYLLGEPTREKSSSVLLKYQLTEKRIKGIGVYLQSMLLGSFPVAKPVLPDAIMGAICRGLAVTCASLGPAKTDSIALGSVLPQVHIHLLNLMMDLISLCGRNMIPYGTVICKLIAQELKWTTSTDWPYAMDKPFRKLRAVVYKALRCWLSVGRSASSLETTLKEIIAAILLDAKVEKQKVTLKVMKGQGSSHGTDYGTESRSEKLAADLANEDLCLQSLKCLQSILSSYSAKLETDTCKTIQETVIELLYGVQNAHESPPVPYRSTACRRQLYNNVISLCLEPHHQFPPPVTFAVALLNTGLSDPASEVSTLCMSGLSSIEKIIHPSGPPLPGVVHQQGASLNLQSNQVSTEPLNTFTYRIPTTNASSQSTTSVAGPSADNYPLSTNDSVDSAKSKAINESVEKGSVEVNVENEDIVDEPSSSNLVEEDSPNDVQVGNQSCSLLQTSNTVNENSPSDVEEQSISLLLTNISESEETAIVESFDSQSISTRNEEIVPSDTDDLSSNVESSKTSTEIIKGPMKRPIEKDVESSNEYSIDESAKKQKTLPVVNGSNYEEDNGSVGLTKVNGVSDSVKNLTNDFVEESVLNDEEMMSCFVDEVTWDKN
ncbi:proline-, glutamic acid- and leucine-rich protein 1 [Nilaparvata lugens]|uniref:proline-, glutamic acid- and leucine-rich protein 1 n=1 Tax=Nilaparvata lugens TaxID=108931 RepID=UPI00193D1798|nr:proline-, glutamic acid- and leucine-rich protein 1 [Nilaparvata lugens]